MAEKEYIERDKAIDYLMEIIDRPNHPEWVWRDEICGSLNTIPAANVRPVVRGRWIKYAPHNSDMMTCSECEKYWILEGDQYDYHFCPNCGAIMEES